MWYDLRKPVTFIPISFGLSTFPDLFWIRQLCQILCFMFYFVILHLKITNKIKKSKPLLILWWKHKCRLQGRIDVLLSCNGVDCIVCHIAHNEAQQVGTVVCICVFIVKGMVLLTLVHPHSYHTMWLWQFLLWLFQFIIRNSITCDASFSRRYIRYLLFQTNLQQNYFPKQVFFQ